MVRIGWALAASLLLALVGTPVLAADPKSGADETIIVRGKRPTAPSTTLWFEEAYEDYPTLGPKFAKGLVIWNHPLDWTGLGPDVPPIKAIAGMAALGWDVVRLQRNPRMPEQGQWQMLIDPMMAGLAEQVEEQTRRGYKRVIVAGQGFGGGVALESALAVNGLYGIIGFAPNTGVARNWGKSTVELPDLVHANELWTTSRLQTIKPVRLFLLFPTADGQMFGHDRGADARKILSARGDMPFVLVDEAQGVPGHFGADTRQFEPFATCLDYFFEPAQAPHNGEFHCGVDEMPAALAKMGVKPGGAGGQSWFGYSSRGEEIYLELLSNGRVAYGTGHGPYGKDTPRLKTYDAQIDEDTISFALTDDLMARGTRSDQELRLNIDLPDKTRAVALLHRVDAIKSASN